MTVSSIVPVNNYTGNSSNTIFDFDFLIENETELVVQHVNEQGIITTLKHGVDYSIAEIGNKNGSYIVFPIENSTYDVLSGTERISLILSLSIKQESEFHNSSYFNLNVLEWTFDYIVRILQILNRKIERCVKAEECSEITPSAIIDNINEINTSVSQTYSSIKEISQDVFLSAEMVQANSVTAREQAEIATQKAKEAGLPIGSIFALSSSSSYVPEGCLLCDGAEYTKSQFNDLWLNYIETQYLNICSYSEYDAEIAENGHCTKFAVDFLQENFKVPLINNVISDIKNTIPVLGNGLSIGIQYSNGTLAGTAAASDGGITAYTGNYGKLISETTGISGSKLDSRSLGLTEDASNSGIIADISESKKYLDLRYFVVVSNGTINYSMMDWSSWGSNLQSKANSDFSNCTKPYIVETSDKSILPSWYRVWSDGWCEQGGTVTVTTETNMIPVTFLKSYADLPSLLTSISTTETYKSSTTGANINSVIMRAGTTSLLTTTGFNFCHLQENSSNGSGTAHWLSKGYIR